MSVHCKVVTTTGVISEHRFAMVPRKSELVTLLMEDSNSPRMFRVEEITHLTVPASDPATEQPEVIVSVSSIGAS